MVVFPEHWLALPCTPPWKGRVRGVQVDLSTSLVLCVKSEQGFVELEELDLLFEVIGKGLVALFLVVLEELLEVMSI